MSTISIHNILNNLSQHKDVKKLVKSFNTLADELKKKQDQLNVKINKQTEARVAEALERYQKIVSVVNSAEGKLESEINKAMKVLKRSAQDIEKNLVLYKKKAMAKRSQIEKTLFKTKSKKTKKGQKKSGGRKTSKKRTTRKAV